MASRIRRFFLTIHNNDKGKLRIIELLNSPIGTIKNPKIAFIEHGQDIDENGEQKLTHWHAVIEYENARTFEAMKKNFPDCHIEESKNLYASIQYLTHKNDPSKHQYLYENIITNDKKWLKYAYDTPLQQETKDKEKLLIEAITSGKYETIYDLILSQEFEMVFISQRRWIIEQLFVYKTKLNIEKENEILRTLRKDKEELRKEKEELKKQIELLKGAKIVDNENKKIKNESDNKSK